MKLMMLVLASYLPESEGGGPPHDHEARAVIGMMLWEATQGKKESY